ncbi:hypothetical protein KVT40_008277 [Elsinoe batatas]|uniref:Alkaline phosphatase D n=1 Tax=Elsinoe batatas TaxID=2601811 RepID=A0A8K0KWK3_9PEZI|nr:hypothetical protein KVT40_008277 [Elsinoe batatas]
MMKAAVALLSLAGVALASWTKNLNYRSPSEHHPGLGISLHKVNKRNVPGTHYSPSQLNFTHGVASGDPYPDSVIIWTRASPMFANVDDNSTVSGTVPLYGHGIYNKSGVTTAPICVEYKVSEEETFDSIADSGVVYTSSDIDYTVKVEANGLEPFTSYFYQFNICGSTKSSPVGRTKTTPLPEDSSAQVGLAIYSCSNFPFGYFNAYGNAVRKGSVDYVVHLGDYIYEYAGDGDYGNGAPIGRFSNPPRIIYTLYDYRARHANYREDQDLLLSHQNYPWIPVWDDHEVSDNGYRDGSSNLNNTEDSFIRDGGISVDQRKMNAVRAYFEWMPIRQVEMDDNLRIWRSFSVGSLFDLIMLDTRNYDRSITDLYWNTEYIHRISNEASRSLMGSRQENWFYNTLGSSAERGATWRLIGSQIIFSQINQSLAFGNDSPFNLDAWDGYVANRNRTLEYLTNNNIGNNIFMAGDSHASWVSDLTWLGNAPYDPETGAGSLGAEFAGSAVSSPCPYGQNISLARAAAFSQRLVNDNPELQWQDLYYRGYYELHISHEEVVANFFGMPTIINRNPNEISIANFTVKAGENRIQRPVAGGIAESGFLKGGEIRQTNLTNNTETGQYFISPSDLEHVLPSSS